MSDEEGQPGREDEARQVEERRSVGQSRSLEILRKNLALTDEDIEVTITVRRPRSRILREVPKSSLEGVESTSLVLWTDADPADKQALGDADHSPGDIATVLEG